MLSPIARELRLWIAGLALFGQLLAPLAHLHARALSAFDAAATLCAPGGSAAADSRGDGTPPVPDGRSAICPPCTLAGGTALPPVQPFADPPSAYTSAAFVEPAARAPACGGAAAYGSRGPPVGL